MEKAQGRFLTYFLGGKRQHHSQPTLLTVQCTITRGDGDRWETHGPGLAPGLKLVLCDSQELPGLLVNNEHQSRRERAQLADPQSWKHTMRGTTRARAEPGAPLQIQPAPPGPSLPLTLPRTWGTTRTLSPFGQQHDGVLGAMHQAHDGIAIVVPVDDQSAPTDAAHQPADGNGRQARGVLGKRDLEAVEEAQAMAV